VVKESAGKFGIPSDRESLQNGWAAAHMQLLFAHFVFRAWCALCAFGSIYYAITRGLGSFDNSDIMTLP
jgi:hypothetical protein